MAISKFDDKPLLGRSPTYLAVTIFFIAEYLILALGVNITYLPILSYKAQGALSELTDWMTFLFPNQLILIALSAGLSDILALIITGVATIITVVTIKWTIYRKGRLALAIASAAYIALSLASTAITLSVLFQ
jgi:hypothetical protein